MVWNKDPSDGGVYNILPVYVISDLSGYDMQINPSYSSHSPRHHHHHHPHVSYTNPMFDEQHDITKKYLGPSSSTSSTSRRELGTSYQEVSGAGGISSKDYLQRSKPHPLPPRGIHDDFSPTL